MGKFMKDNYSNKDYDFDIFSDDVGTDHRRDVRRRPPAKRPSKRSHRRRTRIRIMMVSGALLILLPFPLSPWIAPSAMRNASTPRCLIVSLSQVSGRRKRWGLSPRLSPTRFQTPRDACLTGRPTIPVRGWWACSVYLWRVPLIVRARRLVYVPFR